MSNWSFPNKVYNPQTGNYESDGLVYMSADPVTSEDMWDLYEYFTSSPDSTWESPIDMFAAGVHLDRLSLVGKHHPDWSSHWQANGSTGAPKGGSGSHTYQKQRCGAGVQFTREPIWHISAAGDYVRELPPNCGAYHTDLEMLAHAGPEAGSEAEALLGEGSYYFNDEAGMYEIEGGEMLPLPPEPTITECPHCVAEFLKYLEDRPQ